VPAGLVADGDDLAEDAQLLERGYFPKVTTPEGEDEVFDGIPFLANGMAGKIRAPGPLRGEHGSQVLQEVLKMSAAEIEELRAEGVIA
jgi:crotonobetainyl-CoA:carnitine CoA-transferase CaiB-like acyl-CoA transferase